MKWSIVLGTCIVFSKLAAQTNYTADDYIRMYHDAAVNNMVSHKVPASITLAQGLFESGFGNSPLALNANNHFGIKCHDWTGETYHHDDDAPQECFRKYASVQDSYADHANFLKGRKRYAKCFELEICDYKGWARELKAAGYATLPTYPEKIVGLIERYKLFAYDSQALALMGLVPENKLVEEKKEEPTTIEDKKNEERPTVVEKTIEKAAEKVEIVEKVAEEKKRSSREVLSNNGVSFVIAKNGDSQSSLASEFDLAEWQIRRYNDLEVNEAVRPGSRVYIEPKKERSEEVDSHIVVEGENLEQIAQFHGIKKAAIMEMNDMPNEVIFTGQTLKLK